MSSIDYKEKYLKYKNKYLALKNQLAGKLPALKVVLLKGTTKLKNEELNNETVTSSFNIDNIDIVIDIIRQEASFNKIVDKQIDEQTNNEGLLRNYKKSNNLKQYNIQFLSTQSNQFNELLNKTNDIYTKKSLPLPAVSMKYMSLSEQLAGEPSDTFFKISYLKPKEIGGISEEIRIIDTDFTKRLLNILINDFKNKLSQSVYDELNIINTHGNFNNFVDQELEKVISEKKYEVLIKNENLKDYLFLKDKIIEIIPNGFFTIKPVM